MARERLTLGFHTAGLLLHDEPTAVEELAKLGYSVVAVRPRRGHLDPRHPELRSWIGRLREVLEMTGLRLVLDADGRFMYDPRVAAGPSLVSSSPSEAAAARDWICQMIDIGADLGAEVLTFAVGAAPSPLSLATDELVLERLAVQLGSLLSVAGDRVPLAVRPAAGQAIPTVAQFERMMHWVEGPQELRLAADIGEMLAGGELPIADRLARNIAALGCVYLCDRISGGAGDRRFGHGEVALGRIIRSLDSLGFSGPVILRVEGHSECGLAAAAEAIAQLDA